MAAVLLAALAVAVPAHPCRASLPTGPAVPAPIVLRTSCGGFLLAPTGRVRRLPRHWFAAHGGGTGRRWGAHLNLRRNRAGAFFLLLRGRLVWRSHGLYPNDGGNVAFGPHRFAFATYRRGIFVTDLRGPERLVASGRGLAQYDFDDAGRLIVSGARSLAFLDVDGRTLSRFRIRPRNGFGFDAARDTLYFVTPTGILAAAHGTRLRLLRPLARVDGSLMVAEPNLLVFSGARSITVTRRDGSVVARTRWSEKQLHSDAGVAVSADGRAFAFRLSNAGPGRRSGTATVYILRSGATHATAVFRHRLGPSGCASGAGLEWNRGSVLYSSSDGRLAVIETRARHAIDLTPLAHRLPHRSAGEQAYAGWRRDFPR
jgi:hypothetical protein